MNPLTEFYVFSAVIWGSLLAGTAARHHRPTVSRCASPLLRFNAITFPVLGFFVGFWRLDLQAHGWRLLLVPVIAATVSMVSLLAARVLARRWELAPEQYGVFLFSAAISNIGLTFGMPLCFALFGLDGFALAALYVLYFPFFVFIVLFTLADRLRRQADGHDVSKDTVADLARAFFRDPFRTVPITGIAAGFAMNLMFGKDAIPAWLRTANHAGLYINLLLAFLAVGFTIHAGALRRHVRPIAALCGIKFFLSPAVGILLALLFGFSGPALAVIGIEAACPVAIFAVITAAIYGLDEEFAGAALIVTTALATLLAFGLLRVI